MSASSCRGGVSRIDSTTAAGFRDRPGAATIWEIDGATANSRNTLFSALARTLRFPEYFGHNWDATYDCLTDLAAGDDRVAALLITRGDLFLQGMGPEWETGQRVFTDAAEYWDERGRLLLITLVSDTALSGVPVLATQCLAQVLSEMDPGQEITAADDRIGILNRSGAFEEALRVALDLVDRFPGDPRAHFVLGGAFDFQDREAEAVPPYERAWELGLSGDDVPRFYVQYGSTLRNVGQFDESVRILREGRDRFPDNAAIQAFLALALFSAGQAAEALATALSILTANAETVDLAGYERALGEYIGKLQPLEDA